MPDTGAPDATWSERLGVPNSIRVDTRKPTALEIGLHEAEMTRRALNGGYTGIHWVHAPYYMHRLRPADSNNASGSEDFSDRTIRDWTSPPTAFESPEPESAGSEDTDGPHS